MKGMSARLLLEAILALVSLTLLFATLVSREWIEFIFGVDPDRGSGSLEWAIVAGLFAIALIFSYLARSEWRRAATRTSSEALLQ